MDNQTVSNNNENNGLNAMVCRDKISPTHRVEDGEQLFWWEREGQDLERLSKKKKTKGAPHRKSRWIYTKISGRDYYLYLTAGRRIPRTEDGQRKRARKIEKERRIREVKSRIEALQKGKTLDMPFLNEKENLILSLRSMGFKRADIARRLSGGRRGWAISTGAVRGVLARCYKKLKVNNVEIVHHGKFMDFHKRF